MGACGDRFIAARRARGYEKSSDYALQSLAGTCETPNAGGSFVTVETIDGSVEQWFVEYAFLKSRQSDSVTLYLPMKAAAVRAEGLGDLYSFSDMMSRFARRWTRPSERVALAPFIAPKAMAELLRLMGLAPRSSRT